MDKYLKVLSGQTGPAGCWRPKKREIVCYYCVKKGPEKADYKRHIRDGKSTSKENGVTLYVLIVGDTGSESSMSVIEFSAG